MLVKVEVSDVELANELLEDASLSKANLLLHWKLSDSEEWTMDSTVCMRTFCMDRGTNWSGRVGDRKNFRQANK